MTIEMKLVSHGIHTFYLINLLANCIFSVSSCSSRFLFSPSHFLHFHFQSIKAHLWFFKFPFKFFSLQSLLHDQIKNSERFHLKFELSFSSNTLVFWASNFSELCRISTCEQEQSFLNSPQFQKWSNSFTIFIQCRFELHQKSFEQNKLLKSDYELLLQGFIKIGQFDNLALHVAMPKFRNKCLYRWNIYLYFKQTCPNVAFEGSFGFSLIEILPVQIWLWNLAHRLKWSI